MPGIVGLITDMPVEHAEAELALMVKALHHESFYVSGTWSDPSLGLYVGWVARKGSFGDCMPVCDGRNDVTLIFSGEEYSDAAAGHDGLAYLVRSYEEDHAFPAGLNGRFHGIIADRKSGTAVLFNDRYGMGRLYYHEAKDAVYFAAEAKAILAVRRETRKLDCRGLGEFVSCGCVLENRTLFERVAVLPPGAAWVVKGKAIADKRRYFDPHVWEEQPVLDAESYYYKVRDAFSGNLHRYFQGREGVGISLTGGLDTRMILAWHKARSGSLPCYTFGGMFRDCRDVRLARQVAQLCGQPHQIIEAGSEFLTRFPHYAERAVHLTDGCVEVGSSPVLYVNEKARSIAPVRMTGNYGDQVLRRLRAFKPQAIMPGLFQPDFMPHVRTAENTYTDLTRCHPLTFVAFRQAPWHYYGLLALEQSQLTLRSPYMDNEIVRSSYRAPKSTCENNDVRVRLIADGNRALIRLRTDLGFGASNNSISGKALQRWHLFTMKAEYAYDHGMPQWVSRIDHVLAPLHLERIFLGRHKYYHFRVWYRDALSEYVRAMLLDRRTLGRPYLQRSGVEAVVRGHLDSGLNHTFEIHKLLTLELVHRLFLDT